MLIHHRAYQPLTPANNLYLKQSWDNDVYRFHRRKVKAATSVIDCHGPRTYLHLHINWKKMQREGQRQAEVDRENRLLLERMAHIMRQGRRVEYIKHDYCRKSLNRTKRYRDLLIITYENLAILKRINAREPIYSHKRWENDWQLNRRYMMNITKYPNHWFSTLQPVIKHQQREANRQIKSRQEEQEEQKQKKMAGGASHQQPKVPTEPQDRSTSVNSRRSPSKKPEERSTSVNSRRSPTKKPEERSTSVNSRRSPTKKPEVKKGKQEVKFEKQTKEESSET